MGVSANYLVNCIFVAFSLRLIILPLDLSLLPPLSPSLPLSPQTPSLPVPLPANDVTREKQIPFRQTNSYKFYD